MWLLSIIGFALIWAVAIHGLKQAYTAMQADTPHADRDNVYALHASKEALAEIQKWPSGNVTAA